MMCMKNMDVLAPLGQHSDLIHIPSVATLLNAPIYASELCTTPSGRGRRSTERIIVAIRDGANTKHDTTRGGPGGNNMLMCLLGNASVRSDVWGGNHGGTKSSAVGL